MPVRPLGILLFRGSVCVLFRGPAKVLTAGADVLTESLHGTAGAEAGEGDGKKEDG